MNTETLEETFLREIESRPKILMVDDKPENLLALERLLKDLPLELYKAGSGNEALKLTLHNDFALALLDIQMPEMDGYELAEFLRQEDNTASMPFIFISAIYTDNINVFRGYEKGAFSYITKPFEPEVLLNKVKFFIEKYQQEQALKHAQRILEKKVEERTREVLQKEKQIIHILDHMLEGAQIIGFDWKYIYVNDALEKQCGYTRRELIGYTMMEKYPGIEHTDLFASLKQSMEERVYIQRQTEFVFPDGSVGWFETSIQPVPEGIFVLSIDVTERKKAETALRELNEELEEKVKTRTEQLQVVNKELEAFSYSVSHDLKAPLRAIQGFSKTLHEKYHGQMDENATRWLDFIKNNAERMDNLISDILEFSRISRREIKKSEVDMKQAALDEFEREKVLYADPVEFIVEDIPKAWGDQVLMEMIWQNLIGNAMKYSSKTPNPRIHISGRQDEKYAWFIISDNGAGFNMKYYDKLFAIFQRLHHEDEFEGTGVGLASVLRIIEKHGGNIRAESTPGQGAIFTFSIPLKKSNSKK